MLSSVLSCLLSRSVVLCPGPWAGSLLEDQLGCSLPLTTLKIPVYYWRVADRFLPHTFVMHTEDMARELPKDVDIWGLPPVEYPGMAKVMMRMWK